MLQDLHIENIAVIEKADVSFTPGLNILSGETGAGKSIVIDALYAVMGARTVVEAVAIAKKVAESMDAYMKALPADNTPDPYADIPVFSTPTSDVLAKQGI